MASSKSAAVVPLKPPPLNKDDDEDYSSPEFSDEDSEFDMRPRMHELGGEVSGDGDDDLKPSSYRRATRRKSSRKSDTARWRKYNDDDNDDVSSEHRPRKPPPAKRKGKPQKQMKAPASRDADDSSFNETSEGDDYADDSSSEEEFWKPKKRKSVPQRRKSRPNTSRRPVVDDRKPAPKRTSRANYRPAFDEESDDDGDESYSDSKEKYVVSHKRPSRSKPRRTASSEEKVDASEQATKRTSRRNSRRTIDEEEREDSLSGSNNNEERRRNSREKSRRRCIVDDDESVEDGATRRRTPRRKMPRVVDEDDEDSFKITRKSHRNPQPVKRSNSKRHTTRRIVNDDESEGDESSSNRKAKSNTQRRATRRIIESEDEEDGDDVSEIVFTMNLKPATAKNRKPKSPPQSRPHKRKFSNPDSDDEDEVSEFEMETSMTSEDEDDGEVHANINERINIRELTYWSGNTMKSKSKLKPSRTCESRVSSKPSRKTNAHDPESEFETEDSDKLAPRKKNPWCKLSNPKRQKSEQNSDGETGYEKITKMEDATDSDQSEASAGKIETRTKKSERKTSKTKKRQAEEDSEFEMSASDVDDDDELRAIKERINIEELKYWSGTVMEWKRSGSKKSDSESKSMNGEIDFEMEDSGDGPIGNEKTGMEPKRKSSRNQSEMTDEDLELKMKDPPEDIQRSDELLVSRKEKYPAKKAQKSMLKSRSNKSTRIKDASNVEMPGAMSSTSSKRKRHEEQPQAKTSSSPPNLIPDDKSDPQACKPKRTKISPPEKKNESDVSDNKNKAAESKTQEAFDPDDGHVQGNNAENDRNIDGNEQDRHSAPPTSALQIRRWSKTKSVECICMGEPHTIQHVYVSPRQAAQIVFRNVDPGTVFISKLESGKVFSRGEFYWRYGAGNVGDHVLLPADEVAAESKGVENVIGKVAFIEQLEIDDSISDTQKSDALECSDIQIEGRSPSIHSDGKFENDDKEGSQVHEHDERFGGYVHVGKISEIDVSSPSQQNQEPMASPCTDPKQNLSLPTNNDVMEDMIEIPTGPPDPRSPVNNSMHGVTLGRKSPPEHAETNKFFSPIIQQVDPFISSVRSPSKCSPRAESLPIGVSPRGSTIEHCSKGVLKDLLMDARSPIHSSRLNEAHSMTIDGDMREDIIVGLATIPAVKPRSDEVHQKLSSFDHDGDTTESEEDFFNHHYEKDEKEVDLFFGCRPGMKNDISPNLPMNDTKYDVDDSDLTAADACSKSAHLTTNSSSLHGMSQPTSKTSPSASFDKIYDSHFNGVVSYYGSLDDDDNDNTRRQLKSVSSQKLGASHYTFA